MWYPLLHEEECNDHGNDLHCVLFPYVMSFRAVEAVSQNPRVQFILSYCELPYERDEHTMCVWKESEPLVGIIWSTWKEQVVFNDQSMKRNALF